MLFYRLVFGLPDQLDQKSFIKRGNILSSSTLLLSRGGSSLFIAFSVEMKTFPVVVVGVMTMVLSV